MASARVGLPAVDPGIVDRLQERAHLNCADDETILMHLGFLTPEKGLEAIVGGLAAARRLDLPVRMVVVGEGDEAGLLGRAAAAVGVADRITFTGWVDAATLPTVPAAADVGIVVRTPSAGETSAAVLRFLACGVPVATGGRHQYLEWPEAAAPRLTPGPSMTAEIARLLSRVGGEGWDDRRRAARSTYEQRHRPELVAAELAGFLRDIQQC
jgi:glycosyltransferase involved in cell wall biosynthesis